MDDAGEPVVVHSVVLRAGGGHGRPIQPGVPPDASAQGLRRQAQGHIGPALHHVYHAGIARAVDGKNAAVRVRRQGGVLGDRPGGGAVPPDAPVPQRLQQLPEGGVGGARLYIGGGVQKVSVHLEVGGPGGLNGEAEGRGGKKSA